MGANEELAVRNTMVTAWRDLICRFLTLLRCCAAVHHSLRSSSSSSPERGSTKWTRSLRWQIYGESSFVVTASVSVQVYWINLEMTSRGRLLLSSGCLVTVLKPVAGTNGTWGRQRGWISHDSSVIVLSASCKHSWPCGAASERRFVREGCKNPCVSAQGNKKHLCLFKSVL